MVLFLFYSKLCILIFIQSACERAGFYFIERKQALSSRDLNAVCVCNTVKRIYF